ncbi:MAG: hypothetical protein KGL35_25020 [Bradyrhizobium sp.]|nr:hypothetical protein [Bradyrhizobium sp.]
MIDAEKIQIAADLIHDEFNKRGSPVDPAVCLALAKRLHEIWTQRYEVRDLPAGAVAKRFRSRYEEQYPHLYED